MSLLLAVPVKDLVNAKQRLIPALSPAERRELARAMLEDVLEAAVAALPGAVLVVTTDPEVEAVAGVAGRHGPGDRQAVRRPGGGTRRGLRPIPVRPRDQCGAPGSS